MPQISNIIVKWTPPESGRARFIQIQSRIAGLTEWTNQASRFDPASGQYRFTSNAAATQVEVRCRYVNDAGVPGSWFTATITTATAIIDYIDIDGTPTRLEDINKDEGDKLGGVAPGADVTGDNTSKDTDAVGGRPSGDVIDAITDRNGALIRAQQLQDEILALTETYGDTASAEAARIAAEAARDASQLASSNSQAARNAARAQAEAAAQSSSDASGFATTASGHATMATQKADAAGQFAQTAEAHVSTATTKAGEAKTYRDEAATSASNASGHATTATQQAGLSAGSAGVASGHAEAASNSATTASTKATEAGNSATAANQSRIDAEAANGTARGHASAASGSASTANESASAASASASQAAGFRDTASTHAQNASSSAAMASADAASARESRDLAAAYYNGIEGSPLAARLQTVETVTTNGTFAAASTVSQLRSEYNSTAATVSSQAGTLTRVDGRTAAYWSVETQAGGRARLRAYADGYGSAIDIAADQVFLGSQRTLAVENGRVTVTGDLYAGSGRVVMDNGSVMKVMGTGFGSSNQFIEWFGPRSSDLATCSEVNAYYYLKTNGDAYFGGRLSSGTSRNAQQTTLLNATDFTLGDFSSAGRNSDVTGHNFINGRLASGTPFNEFANPPPDPFTGSRITVTATYRLERSSNSGASWTVVADWSEGAQSYSDIVFSHITRDQSGEPTRWVRWDHLYSVSSSRTATVNFGSTAGARLRITRLSLNVSNGTLMNNTLGTSSTEQ